MPLWVLGIAGLLMIWVFLIDGSTAFAQEDGSTAFAQGDRDGDGVIDGIDNCPRTFNPGQEDQDGDGRGDWCDNCPDLPNPFQEDLNLNRIGDDCEGLYDGIEAAVPGDSFFDDGIEADGPSDDPFLDDGSQADVPGGDHDQTGIPGFPDGIELDETTKCTVEVLGFLPTGPDDPRIGNDEQLLIAAQCLGGIPGGDRTGGRTFSDQGDSGDRHDGPGDGGDLNQQTIQCIISTVGRMPSHGDDFTEDEKRLVGQNCFGNQSGTHQDIDGTERRVEPTACIESTIGRRLGPGFEPTEEEKRLIGAACFGDHGGGPGGSDGPGDLDEATIRCIESTIGRRLGPGFEPTEEEKRLIGAACFGDHGGGSDGPDAEILLCIEGTIGRLPANEFDLNDQEKIRIARVCFNEDIPDDDTIQCIVDTLGYLPDGPQFMSAAESQAVGQNCFGDAVHEEPDQETLDCILAELGFLPDDPNDLTLEQKILLGEKCFGAKTSDDLNQTQRDCIIEVLGYLPDTPQDVGQEDMGRVMKACFADELPHGSDTATQECVNDQSGGVPLNQLTLEDRQRIGRECFAQGPIISVDSRRGPGAGGLSEALQQCILNTVGSIEPGDLTVEQRRQIGEACFQRPGRLSGDVTASLTGQDQTGLSGDVTASSTGQDQTGLSGDVTASSTGQDQTGVTGGQLTTVDNTTALAPAVRALNQAELQIRDLIIEHNIEVPEMDASGVIGRLNNLRGSLTAGIQVLSIINDLVVKGRDVTDQEFAAVFDALEAQGIDLDIRN